MPEQTTMTPDEFLELLKSVLRDYEYLKAQKLRPPYASVDFKMGEILVVYAAQYIELLALRAERAASQPLVDALTSYQDKPQDGKNQNHGYLEGLKFVGTLLWGGEYTKQQVLDKIGDEIARLTTPVSYPEIPETYFKKWGIGTPSHPETLQRQPSSWVAAMAEAEAKTLTLRPDDAHWQPGDEQGLETDK
jgi:hypothetical protein